jgi:cell division protein ZapE
MVGRLVDRAPVVAPGELIATLRPPPRFADVRFSTYRPDPAQPSQAAALTALARFAEHLGPSRGSSRGSPRGSAGGAVAGRVGGLRGRLGRGPGAGGPLAAGIYLDGGFGVGKTHLLCSLWHASPGPKAYGTFVEITSLVGALGFAPALDALRGLRLLAIDEFELDDPGDTVLISTLLTRLADAGVRLAATSNTQPEDLGAGRFASADFLREIQGLAARFEVLRIDGPDFRRRGLPPPPPPSSDAAVSARAAAVPGATDDDFDALCTHLAGLHPSRYGALVDGIALVGIRGLRPVDDQAVALRLVVLVDRLYDRSVPVVASGAPLDAVFPADLLTGPHRKKYQRAASRLVALARDGRAEADAPTAAGS